MSWHSVPWATGLEIELAIRFDGSTWVDVTDDLRSFSCSISRSRALGVFPPGTASFNLDNRSGDYTPLNGSSPYTGNVLPGRHVRLKARYSATDYPVWYGIVDDWGDNYPQARDGIATLTASQPSKILASYRAVAGSAVVGTDETSGDRVDRILTAAGWPTGTTISAGLVPMQGSDLTDDGMTEIGRAVDAEFGAFWVGPDGGALFEDRYALVTNTRSTTSQVTFGNGGGAEVPYLSDPGPSLSSGLDLVINQSTRKNDGSTYVATVTDSTSVAAMDLTVSDSATLTGSSDAWVYGNAEAITILYGDPVQHPTQITLRPAGSRSVSWAQVFGRAIRDRVTIEVPTPWGATLSSECWLVGVTHQAMPGDWTTTFQFEPASNYDGIGLFVLDSSSLGSSDILGW